MPSLSLGGRAVQQSAITDVLLVLEALGDDGKLKDALDQLLAAQKNATEAEASAVIAQNAANARGEDVIRQRQAFEAERTALSDARDSFEAEKANWLVMTQDWKVQADARDAAMTDRVEYLDRREASIDRREGEIARQAEDNRLDRITLDQQSRTRKSDLDVRETELDTRTAQLTADRQAFDDRLERIKAVANE